MQRGDDDVSSPVRSCLSLACIAQEEYGYIPIKQKKALFRATHDSMSNKQKFRRFVDVVNCVIYIIFFNKKNFLSNLIGEETWIKKKKKKKTTRNLTIIFKIEHIFHFLSLL